MDFQVGEGLVVAEFLVEFGLDVLDEPGFHQQGIHFAVGLDVVDVADLQHQPGGAGIFAGRLQEIAPRPRTQILGLSHVDGAAGVVLHQVHPRRMGKGANLLGRRRVVVDRMGCVGHSWSRISRLGTTIIPHRKAAGMSGGAFARSRLLFRGQIAILICDGSGHRENGKKGNAKCKM